MAIVTIRIVDENPQRYTLRPNTNCLGRMYDNIAEGIQVLFPSYELDNGSSCTMIVYANGTQVDSISVSSGVPFDIRDNLSQYKNVEIGFVFEKPNGYTKNSESKCFYFADALKPIAFTPSDPTQHSQINFLLGNAFVDVKWSETERNTLDFLNLSGGIVQSIELSPFVQEQADLAETDTEADSYVKNKSTKYLLNEGADGTSPYATQGYVTNVDNLLNYTLTSALAPVALSNNYLDLNNLPTSTSDFINNGDGTSPFATENYVTTYGGKIDELYLNNTLQTIIDKKVYLTVDKNTVGLSDVDNTSDINKPVSTAQQNAINAVANSIGNGIITITQGGELKGTFSVNQSSNQTIELDAGSTETIDYASLDNKPSINSITLVGNLSSSDLGLATAAQGSLADTALQPSDVDNSLNDASENPVQNKVLAVLIPSDASSLNPLATQNFVNSSIATNTANFIGTFASITDLNNYAGTVTNNDYAFVVNSVITDNGGDWATLADLNNYNKALLTNFDYAWVINDNKFDLYRFDIVNQVWELRSSHINKDPSILNTAYNRYKATVSGTPAITSWDYEYTLNNSSFTAAQWATINSGLTSADKTKLDGIESGAQVNTIQTISVDNVTITPVDKNINIDLSGKLDKITTAGLNRVYGISSLGDQTIFNVDDSLSNWSLARRNGSGNIRVSSTPTNNNDATPKEYVDNKVTSLTGSGAPTTSTAASFIGQIYLDTTNNKTYQCTAITTESDITTYTWTQLVRPADYATTSNPGTVIPYNTYGTTIITASGPTQGRLATYPASNTEIDNRIANASPHTQIMANTCKPIVPATLDYAVKAGITSNSNVLTDVERINAQTWLGLNTLTGSSAPTTSTVGFVGQIYLDTANSKTYECTAVTTASDVTTYTWVQLIRATDYATNSTGGVVKLSNIYNVGASSGFLTASSLDYSTYLDRGVNGFISKGTLENVFTGKGFNTLTGSSAPTTSTTGVVGQIYLDTTNGKTYQCTAITTESDVTTYTWVQLIRATDYADASNAGAVKVNAGYGVKILSNGILAMQAANNNGITAKSSDYYPIVPATLDFAVKVGVTTNENTLTDTEKANACSWLGTGKMVKISQTDYDDLVDAGTVDTNTYYFIEEE